MWNALQFVATGFLGNVEAVNVRKQVFDDVTSQQKLGCNMSLKVCFLLSHLNSFLVNCRAVSTEHGEHFYQDSSVMENRYKGKWSVTMLVDYC